MERIRNTWRQGPTAELLKKSNQKKLSKKGIRALLRDQQAEASPRAKTCLSLFLRPSQKNYLPSSTKIKHDNDFFTIPTAPSLLTQRLGFLMLVLLSAVSCAHGQTTQPGVQPPEMKLAPAEKPMVLAWYYVYKDGIEAAQKENKQVLLDFFADWCGPCKMMDSQVYADPKVITALQDFVCIKIDVDRDQRVTFAYRAQYLPTTVVLNTYGEIIDRRSGFMPRDMFLRFLKTAKEHASKKTGQGAVSIPQTVPTGEAPPPMITVDAQNSLSDLMELLENKDARVRQNVREELVRRNTAEIRATLVDALDGDYLGIRVAAWHTLISIDGKLKDTFDPWAPGKDRKSAIKMLREKLSDSKT